MRPDRYGRIAERASSQLGLIGWRDLRTIEVPGASFRRLPDWDPRCRHVFANRAAERTWRQDVLAAVLDAREGAVATSYTAARLWRVPGYERRDEIEVLAERGGSHRLCLGRLHETFWLPHHHRDVQQGIPVVAARRLPFELAPLVRPSRLRWVIDFLVNERGLTVEKLALTVAELCRSVDRARPHRLAGSRLRPAEHGPRRDVPHREAKLIIELDSRRWRNTRDGFESDRVRTNDLVLAGRRVLRITWRMLHDQPEKVAALIRRALCGR